MQGILEHGGGASRSLFWGFEILAAPSLHQLFPQIPNSLTYHDYPPASLSSLTFRTSLTSLAFLASLTSLTFLTSQQLSKTNLPMLSKLPKLPKLPQRLSELHILPDPPLPRFLASLAS